MQLLPKKEIDKIVFQNKQLANAEKQRVHEEMKALVKLEDDIKAKKILISDELSDFINQSENRKAILLGEVDNLERRKLKALEPLKNIEVELELTRDRLAKEAEELGDKETFLKTKEQSLAESRHELLEREKLLNTREPIITNKEAELGELDKHFRLDQMRFTDYKLREEKILNIRMHDLSAKENELEAQRKEMQIILDEVEKTKQGFEAEKKLIESRQSQLRNLYNQLNQKICSGQSPQSTQPILPQSLPPLEQL